jgi:hypothetical protein
MQLSKFIVSLIGLLTTFSLFGQISSPGIGKTNIASWYAFGLRQDLDSSGHKESMTYVGFGRSSSPDNFQLFSKPTIFVINEEFHHRIHKNWLYSVGLSYRRQNQYEKEDPYLARTPAIKQEFRLYGRFAYLLEYRRIKFTTTLREDVRTFFTPNFDALNDNLQLRTRIRTQLKINLNKRKTHRLSFSAEAFFATQHTIDAQQNWSPFSYTETRFNLYYSYSPKKIPFVFDFGYMNYLSGKNKPSSTHYFGVDIVWNNPFGKINSKPVEYLE